MRRWSSIGLALERVITCRVDRPWSCVKEWHRSHCPSSSIYYNPTDSGSASFAQPGAFPLPSDRSRIQRVSVIFLLLWFEGLVLVRVFQSIPVLWRDKVQQIGIKTRKKLWLLPERSSTPRRGRDVGQRTYTKGLPSAPKPTGCPWPFLLPCSYSLRAHELTYTGQYI